jgi:hypothetical protein
MEGGKNARVGLDFHAPSTIMEKIEIESQTPCCCMLQFSVQSKSFRRMSLAAAAVREPSESPRQHVAFNPVSVAVVINSFVKCTAL